MALTYPRVVLVEDKYEPGSSYLHVIVQDEGEEGEVVALARQAGLRSYSVRADSPAQAAEWLRSVAGI